ncbi:MAG: sensor domain-containing diguanylate cyclase [Planctomycetota bacterium]|nr:sensor domain-containing diguanylate cyclase [Planctomycetota bacterium]
MTQVTRQSRKDELWHELQRVRQAAEAQRAVLEGEATRLRDENERLQDRARFVEELSERVRAANEKLEILTSLTKELASFDVDGVLAVSVQRIPYLVGARFASVYVLDPVREELHLKHHTHGREIDRVVELEANPNSLMARAVRGRKVLCIDDLGSWQPQAGPTPERPHQERYQTSSCIVAPLIAAGEVQGVLNLADRFDNRPFDEGQLALIRQARDLVAVSLRNARLFDEVQRAARTCSLTGLMNHQAFVDALEAEARRAERYDKPLALLVCNMRGIRLLNANHGHQAGDAVLLQAAHVLRHNTRDVDIAGRIGGSEFGLILPELDRPGAIVLAERLGRLLTGTRFMIGSDTCTVPATLGLGVYRRGMTGPDLLREALEAVDRGRGQDLLVGLRDD